MVQIGPKPPKVVRDEPMLRNYWNDFDETFTIWRAVVWNGVVFYNFLLARPNWSKLVQNLQKPIKRAQAPKLLDRFDETLTIRRAVVWNGAVFDNCFTGLH